MTEFIETYWWRRQGLSLFAVFSLMTSRPPPHPLPPPSLCLWLEMVFKVGAGAILGSQFRGSLPCISEVYMLFNFYWFFSCNSVLHGGLSQEPRRAEGKLLFLPYNMKRKCKSEKGPGNFCIFKPCIPGPSHVAPVSYSDTLCANVHCPDEMGLFSGLSEPAVVFTLLRMCFSPCLTFSTPMPFLVNIFGTQLECCPLRKPSPIP